MSAENSKGLDPKNYTYFNTVEQTCTPAEKGPIPVTGKIIYETKSQTFYYLTPAEFAVFKMACEWLKTPIGKLNKANQLTTNTKEVSQYVNLKTQFNTILKPLVQGPGQNNLAEVINLSDHCWQYLDRSKLKASKSFCVATEANQNLLLEADGSFSIPKLLKQLNAIGTNDQKEIENSFDSLTQALGLEKEKVPKILFGHPLDPKSILVATEDAQLMRYSAGASLSGSLNPNNPNFGFSDDAECKLILGSASLDIKCTLPNIEGYHVLLNGTDRAGVVISVDLGYMQGQGEITIGGFAGASLEGSLSLECGMSTDGHMRVRGTSKKISGGKEAPSNYGIPASADAFAGAKLDGSASLAFCWKNPEHSDEFTPFAGITADGDVALGVGIDADFQIGYNAGEGEFIVHAEAGLTLGLGLQGGFTCAVYPAHILNFVAFVYHKIMANNYQYIGIIEDRAFTLLVNLLTKYVVNAGDDLVSLVQDESRTIVNWWDHFKLSFSTGNIELEQIFAIVNNINDKPENFRFTPPEVKGRVLFILTNPGLPQQLLNKALENSASHGNIYMTIADSQMQQIETAILNVLSYVQSMHDYENVITHMSLNPTEKILEKEGKQRLYNSLSQNGFILSRLQDLHYKLNNGEVVYNQYPSYDQPVQPNQTVLGIING